MRKQLLCLSIAREKNCVLESSGGCLPASAFFVRTAGSLNEVRRRRLNQPLGPTIMSSSGETPATLNMARRSRSGTDSRQLPGISDSLNLQAALQNIRIIRICEHAI